MIDVGLAQVDVIDQPPAASALSAQQASRGKLGLLTHQETAVPVSWMTHIHCIAMMMAQTTTATTKWTNHFTSQAVLVGSARL